MELDTQQATTTQLTTKQGIINDLRCDIQKDPIKCICVQSWAIVDPNSSPPGFGYLEVHSRLTFLGTFDSNSTRSSKLDRLLFPVNLASVAG